VESVLAVEVLLALGWMVLEGIVLVGLALCVGVLPDLKRATGQRYAARVRMELSWGWQWVEENASFQRRDSIAHQQ
jgi:hypothetical protein